MPGEEIQDSPREDVVAIPGDHVPCPAHIGELDLGKAGEKFACDGAKYANVEDGWTGLAFIETAVKSAASNGKWTKFPKL